MGHWLDEPRYTHEMVTIPVLWMTVALSLLIHLTVFFLWLPKSRLFEPVDERQDLVNERMQVRLAALPKTEQPAPTTTEVPTPLLALPKPRGRPPVQPSRTPPPTVLAVPTPAAPSVPALPPTPVPAPPRPSVPANVDLSSYIAAQRRERGELPALPGDNGTAEPNANIAANLPRAATGVATQNSSRGGGIFEIKRMEYDNAAFSFFGWNEDMGRRTPQLIEVRKGDNKDMRIAVVRRMILIIREHSKEDFTWHSGRHPQDIVLSARVSDNAALEDFLLHEFFDDTRQQ